MPGQRLSELYLKLPGPIQDLAATLYGWHLRKLRYGPEHERTLEELAASERWPAERLEALQLRRLHETLSWAWEEVPLYRELWGEEPRRFERTAELAGLPLVRKTDLRRPKAETTPRSWASRDLEEIHTGGTTGTPLTIYATRGALQRNYAFFSRFRRWAGVGGRVRTATFAGRTIVAPDRTRPPYWRRNLASRQLLLSSYHLRPETLDAYVDALAAFGPELIDSYPSSVRPIARRIIETGDERVRPGAVITSSETLDRPTRELLELAFSCPVFDHYGAAEMAAFITQCEAGRYHPNPEFGIVELLEDGRPAPKGEIVATGFINPAMPLVRYATGDRAAWGHEECPCGRAFPVIERIEGRMDDVIITPEGRLIGRLDPIFKSGGGIVETRVVQDAPDHLRVEVVPGPTYREEDGAILLAELARRVGSSMRLDLVTVPELPRTRGGKLRTVVREIDSDAGS